MNKSQMTIGEVTTFLADVFPQAFPPDNPPYTIEALDDGIAVVSLIAGEAHLRPGGTVSGPALMTLADLAMYVLVLAHNGPEALAVTTNLNINFLRKPPPGRLLARARLLKLGRTLAVGEVAIHNNFDGTQAPEEPVAHATVTYSLPKK